MELHKLSEHLDSSETECPCGCGLWRVQPALVDTFEAIRTIVNVKRLGRDCKIRGLTISKGGGVRCADFQEFIEKSHNYVSRYHTHCPTEQGNVGCALDIQQPAELTFQEFKTIVDTLCPAGYGIGVYPQKGFIHIDLGPERRWSK